MDTPPGPLPEGVLIATALRQTGLSTRAAAKRAGMSDGRWHQIVKGFQTVSGQRVPVRGPADTVARMAQVVGVTPEQLADAGREDAAEALRALPPPEGEPSEPTVAELAAEVARLREIVERALGNEPRDEGFGSPGHKAG